MKGKKILKRVGVVILCIVLVVAAVLIFLYGAGISSEIY